MIVFISCLFFVPFANAVDDVEQETFATAENAVEALSSVLEKDDFDSLLDVFGHDYKDELLGGDENAVMETVGIIGRAMKVRAVLEDDGKDKKTLIIGSEYWPFPFSLVKEKRRWRFDTAAGIEEVIDRRIGRNELDAISSCHAFIDAQMDYSDTDRDGDKVLEYAQLVRSTGGKKDGLYWEAKDGEEMSPFGPLVADAAGYLKGRDPGDPFKGYYFKIITRQDSSVPGGRYDYIINGNMIAGFALIAFPAEHGLSGVKSFMCNHLGNVYEKDLGPDGDLIAAGIDVYSQDDSWDLVEE